MGEFLRIMIPLQAAMLGPIWVPLLGVALGKLSDQIRGEQVMPVQQTVRDAKARSEAQRRELADQLAGRRVPPAAAPVRADASVAA